MEYLKCRFSLDCSEELATIAGEILASQVADAGFEAFENNGEQLVGYVQKRLFDPMKLRECINTFPLESVSITYQIDEAENKNWNEAWESEGFAPILIDNAMIVYDAKHPLPVEYSLEKYKYAIAIDACQAFGTGTHQTTQMMLEQILHTELMEKTVIDAGCGSGILSIAAVKCGAKHVFAYDIDEWSVRNTVHNAHINGISSVEATQGDASCLRKMHGKADVVLANINRNILLQDMPRFCTALSKGGILIISGFYDEDASMLVRQAKALGLSPIGQAECGNWCSLVFKQ